MGASTTWIASLALVMMVWASPARAGEGVAASGDPDDFIQPAPREFDGIDVEEKRGAAVPLDLAFTDDTGASVTLGRYFADGLPVVLTFNYSNCPQLCSVQLSSLTKALAESGYAPG